MENLENTENAIAATTQPFTSSGAVEPCDVVGLGKGFKLLISKKHLFDHKLATEFLEMHNCPWERPLRSSHVDSLEAAMRQGTFLWELANLSSCLLVPTKEKYRVNGQHTCWSRLQVPEKDVPPMLVSILHYSASDEADLRRLYALFDRNAPRTKANVIVSYLMGNGAFEGATPRLLSLAAAGATLWLWETTQAKQTHSTEQLVLMMQTEHVDTIKKVLDFATSGGKLPDWMHRASVFAAMLSTFAKAKQASEDFWRPVKTGLEFDGATDPRFKLREYLVKATLNRSISGKKNLNTDAESLYRCCVASWNHWRAGEPCKIVRATATRVKAK